MTVGRPSPDFKLGPDQNAPGRRAPRVEATVCVVSIGCGKSQISVAVDVVHPGRFTEPVALVALDDADAIDPQVPNPKSRRKVGGVLEGAGERVTWDSSFSFLQSLVSCLRLRDKPAPAVAQRNVSD